MKVAGCCPLLSSEQFYLDLSAGGVSK